MTREFSDFLVYRARVPRGASRQRDTVRPIGLDRNQMRMSNFSIHPSRRNLRDRTARNVEEADSVKDYAGP